MLEQYTEGLYGFLQVRAPAGSPANAPAHDHEVAVMIADYYNNNAHDLLTLFYLTPESEGVEPIPDAIHVNGRFKGELAFDVPTRASKTLLHLVCAAGFSMFTVRVDGVNLAVVAVDGTAVEPLTVPEVYVNVAQRVDVLIDWSTLALPANATPGAGVFLRVEAMAEMYAVDINGYIPPYEDSTLVSPPAPLDPHYTASFQFAPLAQGVVRPDYADSLDESDPRVPARPRVPAPVAPSPYVGLNVTETPIDTNIFDAVPSIPLHMPTGTHQLYLEILFWVDEASQVNIGHFNKISHVHNMEGGMMPTLYDKSTYGTPHGSASGLDPASFDRAASKPFGYAPSGNPLPPLVVPYTSEAHYLLPPGAVIVMLINNTDAGETGKPQTPPPPTRSPAPNR